MIDYPAARAVALVVQTGSFDKAAAVLGVTPSAVSQRVRHLEERLGTVLVERGSPCTATDTGAWLCRHVEQVALLETDLLAHMPGLAEGGAPRVTIDVATSSDSLASWFLSAVAPIAAESGHLLALSLDDEEHTADWLRRGRVVAAVTALKDPVQGCSVRPLGRMRYLATASPAYRARVFPAGVTAAALGEAPALTFNQKDLLQQKWARQTFGCDVRFPTHWLPSTQGFVDGCLAGMGWCMNPEALVRDHLSTGRLVELVPGAVLEVPLYWQVNRLIADRLADLTRAVVDTAGRHVADGSFAPPA